MTILHQAVTLLNTRSVLQRPVEELVPGQSLLFTAEQLSTITIRIIQLLTVEGPSSAEQVCLGLMGSNSKNSRDGRDA